jgi:hypothetical protein
VQKPFLQMVGICCCGRLVESEILRNEQKLGHVWTWCAGSESSSEEHINHSTTFRRLVPKMKIHSTFWMSVMVPRRSSLHPVRAEFGQNGDIAPDNTAVGKLGLMESAPISSAGLERTLAGRFSSGGGGGRLRPAQGYRRRASNTSSTGSNTCVALVLTARSIPSGHVLARRLGCGVLLGCNAPVRGRHCRHREAEKESSLHTAVLPAAPAHQPEGHESWGKSGRRQLPHG